jgi:hypothetical protein
LRYDLFQDPSLGRFIVLYTFTARDENDIDVHRGEFITVLNKDDPDWFWIIRDCDGQEGFVPSAFIYPLIVSVPNSSGGSSSNGNSSHSHPGLMNGHHQQQLPLPQSQSSSTVSNNFNVNSLITATSALHIANSLSSATTNPSSSSAHSASISSPNYYNTKPKEPDSIRIQTSAITSIPAINSSAGANSHIRTSTSLPALMSATGQPPPGEKAGTELIMLYDYKVRRKYCIVQITSSLESVLT